MALGKRERVSRSADTMAGLRPSRLHHVPRQVGRKARRPDRIVPSSASCRPLLGTRQRQGCSSCSAIVRQRVAAPPAIAPPQAAVPAAAQTSHDQAATDTVAIAGPLMTTPMSMKTYWSKIQAQIKKPVAKTKKGARQALYDESMVTELKAVPSGERPALIAAVLDQLARAATAGLPSGPVSGATIQADYNQLKKSFPSRAKRAAWWLCGKRCLSAGHPTFFRA